MVHRRFHGRYTVTNEEGIQDIRCVSEVLVCPLPGGIDGRLSHTSALGDQLTQQLQVAEPNLAWPYEVAHVAGRLGFATVYSHGYSRTSSSH